MEEGCLDAVEAQLFRPEGQDVINPGFQPPMPGGQGKQHPQQY